MADNTVEKIFIAAKGGDDKALKILVDMFYKGLEMTNDEEIALAWFCRSASLGEAEALCYLGRYSLNNSEYDKAEKWLLQAVEQGSDEAKHCLDLLYSTEAWEGHDAEKALHWRQQAAEAGHAAAVRSLEKEQA